MMTELAEGPTHVGVRRSLAYWNREFQRIHSPILRYGFSVVSVAIALGVAFALQHYQFRDVELPILDCGHRLHHLVCGSWAFRAGRSIVRGLLRLLLYGAALLLRHFQQRSTLLFHFRRMGGNCRLVQRCSTPSRGQPSSGPRPPSGRSGTAQLAERTKFSRLNQELAKRAAELEATNKELESFAYSVSHDLRAPLRHMVGYSELLQKQASSLLDDKSRGTYERFSTSAKRMGNLIDDLLAFSRIGRAETKKTAVDLEQLVKEVVAEIGQDTKGRDIAWKIGALPVCYGDRSMLKLVVVNLVSNAVKFTRMRTRAEIEIGCADGEEDEVEVFVRDNGAGFDMQYVRQAVRRLSASASA